MFANIKKVLYYLAWIVSQQIYIYIYMRYKFTNEQRRF